MDCLDFLGLGDPQTEDFAFEGSVRRCDCVAVGGYHPKNLVKSGRQITFCDERVLRLQTLATMSIITSSDRVCNCIDSRLKKCHVAHKKA